MIGSKASEEMLFSLLILTLTLTGFICIHTDELLKTKYTFQSLPPPECFTSRIKPRIDKNELKTVAEIKTNSNIDASSNKSDIEFDKEKSVKEPSSIPDDVDAADDNNNPTTADNNVDEDGDLGERWDDMIAEWHDIPDPVDVYWEFGAKTCSSRHHCFQTSLGSDDPMLPQIPPISIQLGSRVRFYPSQKMESNFSMIVYEVNEHDYRSCDFSNISSSQPLVENFTSKLQVQERFLSQGIHYFIAETDTPLYRCDYGLRVMINVKAHECSGLGEPTLCWKKGRCLATTLQPHYQCSCCHGFTGEYCGYQNGCFNNPCKNNGTCFALGEDSNGDVYECICPTGFYGTNCELEAENLCDVNKCLHGGSCLGNKTDFTCNCLHGYHGHHCEVNENECASQPCAHGICVDKVGGYQCYCTPGFGGRQCEIQFNQCSSNPCKNQGVCIQGDEKFYCDCPVGYTGHDCSVKVDLCSPSPCQNAVECVENGHSVSCTCQPGFTGHHCEVNIYECISSPCHNGGKCIDMTAGYRCICPHGIHGTLCEFASRQLYEHSYKELGSSFQSPWKHRTRLQNLAVVAGTLGSAVLLAFIVVGLCYCKVNETYKSYNMFNRAKGYKRQLNDGVKKKIKRSSILKPRPSAEAIIAATMRSMPSTSKDMAGACHMEEQYSVAAMTVTESCSYKGKGTKSTNNKNGATGYNNSVYNDDSVYPSIGTPLRSIRI